VPRLVALDLPWDERFVDALRRVWDGGDAVAVVDHRLPPVAAKEQLATLRPTHLLGADSEMVPVDGGMPVERGDALVVATSGSSGSPRAAVLTHGAVRSSAEATSRCLGVDPESDRWLACIPLSHAGGLGVVTRAVITGTPLVTLPSFDSEAVEKAASEGVTLVSLVAAALARVEASLFRVILLGGAAAPTGLPGNVVTTYGMTETCGGVVYDGVPLEDVEIAVEEDARAGEILVRAPMLLRCYRDGTDPFLPGGWFPTGDAGSVDSEGRLQVSGRISETINTGGEKVWPAAVERVIITHPLVAEVAVAGRPDPQWGERVVAFVVLRDAGKPLALEEIRDFVSERLPRWSAPQEIVVLDALPQLPSGKVARRLLP
jgi:O-succinylbenzoic acid--CoA ligase